MTKSLESIPIYTISRKFATIANSSHFLGQVFWFQIGYMWIPGNWANRHLEFTIWLPASLCLILLFNLMAMVVLQHILKTGRGNWQGSRPGLVYDQYGKRLRFLPCGFWQKSPSPPATWQKWWMTPLLLGCSLACHQFMVGVLLLRSTFYPLTATKRGQRPLEFVIVGLVAIIFGSFQWKSFGRKYCCYFTRSTAIKG